MEPIEIAELTTPKLDVVSFKVSKEEKEFIVEYCNMKNFRMSAMCRVAVLNHINNRLKDEQ